MKVSDFIRSRVFHSTEAAVSMAKKSPKNYAFAETLLLNKLRKVVNANASYNIAKATKYHNSLTELKKTLPLSKRDGVYSSDRQLAESTTNSTATSYCSIKGSQSFSDLAAELKRQRTEISGHTHFARKCGGSETIPLRDAINNPENLRDTTENLTDACDKVIDDNKVNMQQMRRITTNLRCLAMQKNESIASEAEDFLKNPINGKTLCDYGDMKDYDDNTLDKVKNCVRMVRGWASKLSF
ncbi:hypothetical protein [Izhakiella australiensis]|nr:hypothetical protein [Izhakiella australiensis]